ncbi:hypothetical protein [Micromonospora sp. NPDC001898]|uniref:hypothetical protein n=1 Tax=Micromonospora sp. NPDC001898 TaxID=3364221 RepID=UPI0036A0A889
MTPIVLLASLATLGYAAWYLLLCMVAPWKRCDHCDGTGHHRTIIGTHRECRRCDGTRLRVRTGRRIIEHIRDEYRAGHQ